MNALPSAQWDLAETARLWQTVQDCVEAFIEAWEATEQPPPIDEYAPREDPDVRRFALVELIKVDLEYRRSKDRSLRALEEYLAEFPEVSADGFPHALAYEEFHLRRRAGESVEVEEYLRRFPDAADELRRLLNFEGANVTTTLFTGEPAGAIDVNDCIDDFDILAELGKGAFAKVFLARQRSMQRIVALKVSADRGLEAQTLAQLDHPHIVRVYDQRVLADRGLRLLYMQYLSGGTLQPVVDAVRASGPAEQTGKLLLGAIDRALDQRGESPPTDSLTRQRLSRASWGEAVCWIGARLAAALDYAHKHGVLHRDVKPANVLLAADGAPKLVDFNIACCSKVEGATPAAYFGGSLAYMSPEQLEACNPAHDRRPDDMDARSEVFSLGVLLWELLCGRRPFADEPVRSGWPQLLSRMTHLRRTGLTEEALAQLPRDLPPGAREALLRALAPEPADRFASAGEMAAQLEMCLRPTAQRLLHAPRKSWRQWISRFPITALAAAAVLPNVALSALNIVYNVPSLIDPLPQAARDLFYGVQIAVVNGLLYTLALGTGIALCWPVLRTISRLREGRAAANAVTPSLRARSLHMGDAVFGVTLLAWSISGLIFPIWLRMHLGKVPGISTSFYVHFLMSQILFGLVASTLTFFIMTFLTVRALHPLLVKQTRLDGQDLDSLGRLSQRVWIYFAISVAAPFLALGSLFLIDSKQQWAFGAISLVGLFGFFVSFGLARFIQNDLAALALAAAPVGESLPGETQGFDHFGGSRRVG